MGGYRTQKTGKETRKEGLQIFVTSSITTGEFCIESDPLQSFNTKLFSFIYQLKLVEALYQQYIPAFYLSSFLSQHCFYITSRRAHDVPKIEFQKLLLPSLSPCYLATQVAQFSAFPTCLYMLLFSPLKAFCLARQYVHSNPLYVFISVLSFVIKILSTANTPIKVLPNFVEIH